MFPQFSDYIRDILESQSRLKMVLVVGLHGDEPVGAYISDIPPDIKIIGPINQTGKRRLDGKDLNRQFNKADGLAEQILDQIKELRPQCVVDSHEDDEVNQVYVYCSVDIQKALQKILSQLDIPLAQKAHSDFTEGGTIVSGEQPYTGTLERECKNLGISYCCIETPITWPLNARIKIQTKIINDLYQYLSAPVGNV